MERGTRPEAVPAAEQTGRARATWFKAIIVAVADGPSTIDDIERRVGEGIESSETVPIEEYTKVLLAEEVLSESSRPEHVELTEAGLNILEGVLAERAAENAQVSN